MMMLCPQETRLLAAVDRLESRALVEAREAKAVAKMQGEAKPAIIKPGILVYKPETLRHAHSKAFLSYCPADVCNGAHIWCSQERHWI